MKPRYQNTKNYKLQVRQLIYEMERTVEVRLLRLLLLHFNPKQYTCV
jgi:hypothetical protein